MKEISEMHECELEQLEGQIALRRLAIVGEKLSQYGVATRIIESVTTDYILVYSPISSEPNAWADVAECRRLADTLANLPKEEAYLRWLPKVAEKFPAQEYTRTDAIRDTRAARAKLDEQYAGGEVGCVIDADLYADLYRSTSFMDLAK